MAIDDDPLIVMTRQIQEDASDALTVGASIAQTIASITMPGHIGEYVTGVLGAVSQRRWNERIAELLTQFAKAVTELKDQIPDERYYEGEEFQALIYEAVDQERTNRYEEKRKMLAVSLARSGTERFIRDSQKELYLRCLRDLTPLDIRHLKGVMNASVRPNHKGSIHMRIIGHVNDHEGADSINRRLQGLGLLKSVELVERDRVRQHANDLRDVVNALNTVLTEKRSTKFAPTKFGVRFMQYITELAVPRSAD